MKKICIFAALSLLCTVCFSTPSLRASSVPLTSRPGASVSNTAVSTTVGGTSDSSSNVSTTNSRVAISSPLRKKTATYATANTSSSATATSQALDDLDQRIKELIAKQTQMETSLVDTLQTHINDIDFSENDVLKNKLTGLETSLNTVQEQNIALNSDISSLATKAEVAPEALQQKLDNVYASKSEVTPEKIADNIVKNDTAKTLLSNKILKDDQGKMLFATKAEVDPQEIAQKLLDDDDAKQLLSAEMGLKESEVTDLLKRKQILKSDGETLNVATSAELNTVSGNLDTVNENLSTVNSNLNSVSSSVAALTPQKIAQDIANNTEAKTALANKILKDDHGELLFATKDDLGDIAVDEGTIKTAVVDELEAKNIWDKTNNRLKVATKGEVDDAVVAALVANDILDEGTQDLKVATKAQLNSINSDLNSVSSSVAALTPEKIAQDIANSSSAKTELTNKLLKDNQGNALFASKSEVSPVEIVRSILNSTNAKNSLSAEMGLKETDVTDLLKRKQLLKNDGQTLNVATSAQLDSFSDNLSTIRNDVDALTPKKIAEDIAKNAEARTALSNKILKNESGELLFATKDDLDNVTIDESTIKNAVVDELAEKDIWDKNTNKLKVATVDKLSASELKKTLDDVYLGKDEQVSVDAETLSGIFDANPTLLSGALDNTFATKEDITTELVNKNLWDADKQELKVATKADLENVTIDESTIKNAVVDELDAKNLWDKNANKLKVATKEDITTELVNKNLWDADKQELKVATVDKLSASELKKTLDDVYLGKDEQVSVDAETLSGIFDANPTLLSGALDNTFATKEDITTELVNKNLWDADKQELKVATKADLENVTIDESTIKNAVVDELAEKDIWDKNTNKLKVATVDKLSASELKKTLDDVYLGIDQQVSVDAETLGGIFDANPSLLSDALDGTFATKEQLNSVSGDLSSVSSSVAALTPEKIAQDIANSSSAKAELSNKLLKDSQGNSLFATKNDITTELVNKNLWDADKQALKVATAAQLQDVSTELSSVSSELSGVSSNVAALTPQKIAEDIANSNSAKAALSNKLLKDDNGNALFASKSTVDDINTALTTAQGDVTSLKTKVNGGVDDAGSLLNTIKTNSTIQAVLQGKTGDMYTPIYNAETGILRFRKSDGTYADNGEWNIKGAQGEAGSGFKFISNINSYNELPTCNKASESHAYYNEATKEAEPKYGELLFICGCMTDSSCTWSGVPFRGQPGAAGRDAKSIQELYCRANYSTVKQLFSGRNWSDSEDDCANEALFSYEDYNAVTSGATAYCLYLANQLSENSTIDFNSGVFKRLNSSLVPGTSGVKVSALKGAPKHTILSTMFNGKKFISACEEKYNEIMAGDDAETVWHAYCTSTNEKDSSKTNLEAIIKPLYGSNKTCDNFTKDEYSALMDGAKAYCTYLAQEAKADANFATSERGKSIKRVLGAAAVTSLRTSGVGATMTLDGQSIKVVDACVKKYNDIMNAETVWYAYCMETDDQNKTNLEKIITPLYSTVTDCKDFTSDQYNAIMGGAKAYCLSLAKRVSDGTLDTSAGIGKRLNAKLTPATGGKNISALKGEGATLSSVLSSKFNGNKGFMEACEEKYNEIMAGDDAETVWHAYCTSTNEKDSSKTNLEAIIKPLYGDNKTCDNFTKDEYSALMDGAKAYCTYLAQEAKADANFATSERGKSIKRVLGAAAVTSLRTSGVGATMTLDGQSIKVVDACVKKYNDIMNAETVWYAYCMETDDQNKTNLEKIITPLYSTVTDCKDFTSDQYNAIMGGAKAYCLSLAKRVSDGTLDTSAGIGKRLNAKLTPATGGKNISALKGEGATLSSVLSSKFNGNKGFMEACEEKYNEIMAGDDAETVWHAYCTSTNEKDSSKTNLEAIIKPLYGDNKTCDNFTKDEYSALMDGAKAYCTYLAQEAKADANFATSERGKSIKRVLGAAAVTSLRTSGVGATMTLDGQSIKVVDACVKKYNDIMNAETVWYAYCMETDDQNKTNLEKIITPLYSTVTDCKDFTSDQYNAIMGGAKAYCLSLAKRVSDGTLDTSAGIGKRLNAKLTPATGGKNISALKGEGATLSSVLSSKFNGNKGFMEACEEKYNEIMAGDDAETVWHAYCTSTNEKDSSKTNLEAIIKPLYGDNKTCDNFTKDEYSALMDGAKAYCTYLAQEAKADANFATSERGKSIKRVLGAAAVTSLRTSGVGATMTLDGQSIKVVDACVKKYNDIMNAETVWYAYCMETDDQNKTNLEKIITPLYSTVTDCKDFTSDQYNAIMGGAKAYCLSLAKRVSDGTLDTSAGIGKRLNAKLTPATGGKNISALKGEGATLSSVLSSKFNGNKGFMEACEEKYNEIMAGDDAETVWHAYCTSTNEKDSSKTNLEAIIKPLYGDNKTCDNFTKDEYSALMDGAKAYCTYLAQEAKADANFATSERGKSIKRVLGAAAVTSLRTSGVGATMTLDGQSIKVVDACVKKYNDIMNAETVWYAYCMETDDQNKTNLEKIITPLYSTVTDCKDFTSDQYNAIMGGAKAYCLSLAKRVSDGTLDTSAGIGKRLNAKLTPATGGKNISALKGEGATLSSVLSSKFNGNKGFMEACEEKYNEIMAGDDAETVWHAYCTSTNEKDSSKTNLEAIIKPLYGDNKTCDNFTKDEYSALMDGAKAYCTYLAQEAKADANFATSERGKSIKRVLGAAAVTSLRTSGVGATMTLDGQSIKVVDACVKKYNDIMNAETVWYAYCMETDDQNKTNLEKIITPLYSTVTDCKDFTSDQYNAIMGGAKAYCLSLAKRVSDGTLDTSAGIGKRLNAKLTPATGGKNISALKGEGATLSSVLSSKFNGNKGFMEACEEKYNEIMAGEDGEDAKSVEQTYCEEHYSVVQKLFNSRAWTGNAETDCAKTSLFSFEDYTAVTSGARAYCLYLTKELTDGKLTFTSGIGKKLADKLDGGSTSKLASFSGQSVATVLDKSSDTYKFGGNTFVDACESNYNEIMNGENGAPGEDAVAAWCKAHTLIAGGGTAKTSLHLSKTARAFDVLKGLNSGNASTAGSKLSVSTTSGTTTSFFSTLADCEAAVAEDPSIMGARDASEQAFDEDSNANSKIRSGNFTGGLSDFNSKKSGFVASLQGKDGQKGADGKTYQPTVDSEGNLSWTVNTDGSTPNVSTVNIKGAKGDTGAAGANGKTYRPSVDASGNLSWTVNTDGSTPNVNTVNIKGAKGDTGAAGANGKTYRPSVDASGNLSWTVNTDGSTPNVNTVNIKGAKGDTGAAGANGKTYRPSVDASGNLSWTVNTDGSTPNVSTVNIKGAKGDNGKTFRPAFDATTGTFTFAESTSTDSVPFNLETALQTKLNLATQGTDADTTGTSLLDALRTIAAEVAYNVSSEVSKNVSKKLSKDIAEKKTQMVLNSVSDQIPVTGNFSVEAGTCSTGGGGKGGLGDGGDGTCSADSISVSGRSAGFFTGDSTISSAANFDNWVGTLNLSKANALGVSEGSTNTQLKLRLDQLAGITRGTSCSANYYKNGAGVCVACPEYSTSSGGNAVSCTCSGSLTWQNGSCECSGSNVYGTRANCQTVPANADRSSDGQSFVCRAGYYKNGSNCTACAAGTYKSNAGNEACTACPSGQYQDQTGKTSCKTCSSGQPNASATGCTTPSCSGLSINGSCITTASGCQATADVWWDTSAQRCKVCGDGGYRSAGSSSYTQCQCDDKYSWNSSQGMCVENAQSDECSKDTSGTYNIGGKDVCIECDSVEGAEPDKKGACSCKKEGYDFVCTGTSEKPSCKCQISGASGGSCEKTTDVQTPKGCVSCGTVAGAAEMTVGKNKICACTLDNYYINTGGDKPVCAQCPDEGEEGAPQYNPETRTCVCKMEGYTFDSTKGTCVSTK